MSLLEPGRHRVAHLADDAALLTAMVRVELAWLRALSGAGLLKPEQVAAAEQQLPSPVIDPAAVESSGNPVKPLVDALRAALPEVSAQLHRGLTSQDVLDTALMLMARNVLDHVTGSLTAAAADLARLADDHRGSVMPGRTLTRYAVPVTFGLTAAQWLAGILDARDAVATVRSALPIQCGGAAGTLSLAGELVADPVALAEDFARQLDLRWPGLPWHTRRTPVTRLGDALTQTVDALGVIAADILMLGRPEIAEVRERAVEGRGGSSTMPHKQNPVLAVLIRSAALQAPGLGAQLHLCAAQAVDQRPDGAWHAEWASCRQLLLLTATAASQTAELVAGLEVDPDTMTRHAESAATHLLAERGEVGGGPASYLGASDAFVDAVLVRWRGSRDA
ncbi:lyase family protein [Kribbella caucasensis]|uniref:lyase family protein n=1 Tax=Kribbella caucasensis TaxID=2512215 RepID=UPI001EE1381F|nr:lyase family protein [Kribbella sp. VKM Ac-2527]